MIGRPPRPPLFPYTPPFRSLPAVPGWTAKLDWPWSTSAMVKAPPVVRLPAATPTSSVTAPVATPPSTGTSLVPWMVRVEDYTAEPQAQTQLELRLRL